MKVWRKLGWHNFISWFTKSIILKEFLSKLLNIKTKTIQETMSKYWLLPSETEDCVEFLKMYIKKKYDRDL